jgi:hypothetical protein
MLDIYGLAAAHLSELKRTEDDAKARYERGLATVAVPRPGVISRIAALFRQASRSRAARSAGAAVDRTSVSCGGRVCAGGIAA